MDEAGDAGSLARESGALSCGVVRFPPWAVRSQSLSLLGRGGTRRVAQGRRMWVLHRVTGR